MGEIDYSDVLSLEDSRCCSVFESSRSLLRLCLAEDFDVRVTSLIHGSLEYLD